jgi:hypothetical protein
MNVTVHRGWKSKPFISPWIVTNVAVRSSNKNLVIDRPGAAADEHSLDPFEAASKAIISQAVAESGALRE